MEALLIVYRSPNGRDPWTAVKPEEVPEWVKDPGVMARLVNGDMCNDPTIGETGSDWYRVERVPS